MLLYLKSLIVPVIFTGTDRSESDERCLCFCAVVVNAADIVCHGPFFKMVSSFLKKRCSVTDTLLL